MGSRRTYSRLRKSRQHRQARRPSLPSRACGHPGERCDRVAARLLFGAEMYAVGGNRDAAGLAGIPVNRTLFIVYVVSGALAGLGVLIIGLINNGLTLNNVQPFWIRFVQGAVSSVPC